MATFLLIHGACHGGWCWDRVADRLRSAGHVAIAPDLPCEDPDAGLDRNASAAIEAVGPPEELDGDLVVVAHSLGGLLAPLVADQLPVRRLVFVAAIVGSPRMSMKDLASIDSDRDVPLADDEYESDESHRFRFTAAGARRKLYHDCDEGDVTSAIDALRFQRSMWTDVAAFDAWPATEMVSVVCTEDRIVRSEWSERIARDRLGVEPVILPVGHSPFFTRPDDLAEILTAGL